MKALIDADILRYEIGFGAETGWRAIQKEENNDDNGGLSPPWDYVEKLLNNRIAHIVEKTAVDSYQLFLTEGPTFREGLAVTKPYKGNRKEQDRPWHYKNLTAYLVDVLGAEVVTNIEADDRLSIEHVQDPDTILCSRDKDLRQVPGWLYSWELGRQPSFGPEHITKTGGLELDTSKSKLKLTGTGLAFFYSQCLTGDVVDNVPGLPGCGLVKAFNLLDEAEEDKNEMLNLVMLEYADYYGLGWEEKLLEQGRLLWMTRKLNEDGSPVLWEIGMEE